MHVDHVKPRWVIPDNYDSPDNLVTLCPNDHARKTIADRERYGHPTWNRGIKMNDEQKSKQDHSGLELGRTWAKGKKFSQQHRENISASLKGRASPWKGKKLSLEHRAKLSAAHKGKTPWNKGAGNLGYL